VGTILGLNNKRLVLALATFALAGGGGIAVASGVLSSAPPVPPAPAATAISPQLTEHFAVLNGPSADVPSAILNVAVGLNEQFGLNPSLAREVTYSPSSPAIWVIPGSEGMCIHVMTKVESGGCTSLKNTLAGDLQVEIGGKTVYGVAPDGNSKVVVHNADGSTEDVAVEQNVYIISKPGAQSLDLTDGAGQTQTVTIKE
jgi:hypothetical protein